MGLDVIKTHKYARNECHRASVKKVWLSKDLLLCTIFDVILGSSLVKEPVRLTSDIKKTKKST